MTDAIDGTDSTDAIATDATAMPTTAISATAKPATRYTLEPRLLLRAAWVDNPFFDPLDPTIALDIPSTTGHTVRFDLRAGLALDVRPDRDHRLIADLDALHATYVGTAETTAWDATLDLAAHHRFDDTFEAGIGLRGVAAHIDLYPRDDLRWGEARLTARATFDRWLLDALIGLGLRDLPDRPVYATDATDATDNTLAPGQQDTTFRARLDARAWPGDARTRFGGGLAYDTIRTRRGGIDHDTALADAWIAHAIGDFDLSLGAATWIRTFAETSTHPARLDTAAALETRAAYTLAPGIEIALRHRSIRSGSDAEIGRYAQHFAGFEILLWHAIGDPPEATHAMPATATPTLTPDGWRFRHQAPAAAHVALVGDFNRWAADATPLAGPDPEGWWTVTLPLTAGRHGYMFVVDTDHFVRPQDAPSYAADGFGGEVGVIFVLPDHDPPSTPPAGKSTYRPGASDR